MKFAAYHNFSTDNAKIHKKTAMPVEPKPPTPLFLLLFNLNYYLKGKGLQGIGMKSDLFHSPVLPEKT